jgi:hypothetical protein
MLFTQLNKVKIVAELQVYRMQKKQKSQRGHDALHHEVAPEQ